MEHAPNAPERADAPSDRRSDDAAPGPGVPTGSGHDGSFLDAVDGVPTDAGIGESAGPAAWTGDTLRASPHQRADKADRVRSMFGAIAGAYDLNNRLHSFGRDQAWRRKAVRLAGVTPRTVVYDIACGTGDLSEAFARAGAQSVVGIDFTPRMLEVARVKRDRDDALHGRIDYREGDATRLDVPDDVADVVSIAFGIRNVSDPDAALREFRRVLAPGGRLVILEFAEPRNALLRAGNTLYTKHVMPWTATLVARDRSGAYRYLPRSIETFLDPDALRSAVERAGFRDVEQHRMTFGVCVATVAIAAD